MVQISSKKWDVQSMTADSGKSSSLLYDVPTYLGSSGIRVFSTQTPVLLIVQKVQKGESVDPRHGDRTPSWCSHFATASAKSIDGTTADAPKPTSARNEDEERLQCRGVDISSLCARVQARMLFAADEMYLLSTSASPALLTLSRCTVYAPYTPGMLPV